MSTLFWQPQWLKLAFAYARVAPVFYLLPFLGGNLLGGPVLKNTLIVLTAAGLLPLVAAVADPADPAQLVVRALGEALVGLALGIMLALPFWLAQGWGAILDNQRGATLSSSLDPMTGVDVSECANLFNLFAATVFLQQGGLRLMLDGLAESYRLFPDGVAAPALGAVLQLIDRLVRGSLLLAAPVIACLLLTETSLGLLSRFAQQLNAFSVAMTVKSAVTFLLLLLYAVPELCRLVAGQQIGNLLQLLVPG